MTTTTRHHMLHMGLLLAVFGVVGTGLVALTFENTAPRIAENEHASLLRNLHSLVPATTHDNDLARDTVTVTDLEALGTEDPVTVYRARHGGAPVAAILSPVAPDGFNGDIKLLVAITHDGTLIGVRVVTHHETPGLGDYIELERSPWIKGFDGHSLTNTLGPSGWNVKKDGGIFDQNTGATITPRAVVKAVHRCLKYFVAHRDALFATTVVGGPAHEH